MSLTNPGGLNHSRKELSIGFSNNPHSLEGINPTYHPFAQEPRRSLGDKYSSGHQQTPFLHPVVGVGGVSETPQEVVDTNLVVNPQHEQIQAVTTISEQIRYKELFQAFDEKTQRWQSVICKPEFLIAHNLDGRYNGDPYAIWQFDRKYPSATTRIFDNATRRRVEGDEVRVKAEMIETYGDTYTFSVEVRGRRNQAFIDPINNEHLNTLEILVNKLHSLEDDHPKIENPFAYSVIVVGRYQPYTSDVYSMEGQKNRAIGFIVDNLSGELDITTELGGKAINYVHTSPYEYSMTEALSVDHAEALLQFMDAIIPLSTFTQLPERRAAQTKDKSSEEPDSPTQ